MDSLRRALVGTGRDLHVQRVRFPSLIPFHSLRRRLAPAVAVVSVAAAGAVLWWTIATAPWLVAFGWAVAAAFAWCRWLEENAHGSGAAAGTAGQPFRGGLSH